MKALNRSFPFLYRNSLSAGRIENLSCVFERLAGGLDTLSAGSVKMSLVEAFEEGLKKGAAKEIIRTYAFGSRDIFHESVHKNDVLRNANDAVYFLGVAEATVEDRERYADEIGVVRDNFRLLGESAGLCSRMKRDKDGELPYYYHYGAWDSELVTVQFLENVKSLVEKHKAECLAATADQAAAPVQYDELSIRFA